MSKTTYTVKIKPKSVMERRNSSRRYRLNSVPTRVKRNGRGDRGAKRRPSLAYLPSTNFTRYATTSPAELHGYPPFVLLSLAIAVFRVILSSGRAVPSVGWYCADGSSAPRSAPLEGFAPLEGDRPLCILCLLVRSRPLRPLPRRAIARARRRKDGGTSRDNGPGTRR